MLQGINKLGRSWVGRALVTVLFGFLIVSFAIWGIGDIFRGRTSTHVATIGGAEISADAYRNAYQTEYQNLLRQARQTITPEQARALGLDQRVLSRLLTETAFDERTRELGLSIPDASVVSSIQNEPGFAGPNGAFDRNRFIEVLRDNGLSEAQFVRLQRAILARVQVAEALTGDLPVPLAMREAVHRYRTERRAADYLVLTAASLGTLPQPTAEELQTFFDGRKTAYRAPEYRALNVLAIDPTTLAKPDQVTDDEARAFYEKVKTARYGSPERRHLQQIIFPSSAEAQAASDRLKAGTSLEDVARERGLDPAAIELGTLTKAEMLDPATADAAFALNAGAVSAPIEGRFGTVLVKVVGIEPATSRPFEEVSASVRREIALERARAEIQTLHDAIEDQRAGAKALGEIATERGLSVARVDAVDRAGLNPAGTRVLLPGGDALLAAAFRSDVGADNEALRTSTGGYAWFEVTKVDPARDRTLDEVREKVTADWRAEETSKRLADRGREITTRLDGGEDMGAVAGASALTVAHAADLTREAGSTELGPDVVTRLFATPVGKAASVAAADGRRIVFRVTDAAVPPFVTTTQDASATEGQLRSALAEDVVGEFVADVQKRLGVQVFPENMRRAIGGES